MGQHTGQLFFGFSPPVALRSASHRCNSASFAASSFSRLSRSSTLGGLPEGRWLCRQGRLGLRRTSSSASFTASSCCRHFRSSTLRLPPGPSLLCSGRLLCSVQDCIQWMQLLTRLPAVHEPGYSPLTSDSGKSACTMVWAPHTCTRLRSCRPVALSSRMLTPESASACIVATTGAPEPQAPPLPPLPHAPAAGTPLPCGQRPPFPAMA